MTTLRPYKLYFSYGWNYRDAFSDLMKLFREGPEFCYLPYHFPDQREHKGATDQELYRLVRDRVKHSDALVLLCGVYRNEAFGRWMNKEIISATSEFAKPIVAVHRYPELRISSVVRQHADAIVGWDKRSIMEAVRGLV